MATPTSKAETEYLNWLISQVEVEYGARTTNTYDTLFWGLFEREFVWLVANDDNRIQDAMDLRQEALPYVGTIDRPCSVLEIIIGLSRRLAFEAEGSERRWAWQLIENLKLHKMCDPVPVYKYDEIDDILESLVYRTYKRDGEGGFFPLAFPKRDQRKVEIWYQLAAYLEEIQEL